jgi:3-oxoacyl-ACP reductase-like protein
VITIMEAAMSGIEVVVTTDKFDEQEPFYDKIMHGSSRKIIETGGTPGSTRWWVFTDSGSKNIVEALAKSATGTTISCSSNNTVIPAEVIEACKTLRPYPAGAAKK